MPFLWRHLLYQASLLLCVVLIHATDQCSNVQACGATLSTYPLIVEDGSGDSAPLYDELLSPISQFDYTAEPETKVRHSLRTNSQEIEMCSCGDEEGCDFKNDTNQIRLDHSITLHFCTSPTTKICKGARGVVRVIGPAHSSGHTLESVSQTYVFCTCSNGYQKGASSMWDSSDLAVNYRCS